MVYKAYKYRIYPNREQENLIHRTFGCCRFVYNQTLAHRKELYEKENKSMSKFDCTKYLIPLKSQYPWLKEVDSKALENSVINMDMAYKNFFKYHRGYPKFKGKYDNLQSYTSNRNNQNAIDIDKGNIAVDFSNNKIKMPKLGWIKAVLHRDFNGKIKSATLSQVPSGKYYISILVETDHEVLPKTNKKVGIDLGIKSLVITSDGTTYDNPKYLKKYQKRLIKLQRQLSKKQVRSNNYHKQRRKLAKIYEKITNARLYNQHQITTDLVRHNDVIVAENLDIKNMLENHYMAQSISDCGWGNLLSQINYKCELNEKEFIQIDTYFPSSQKCSKCGYINTKIKDLNIRKWTCPNCREEHDRDINAATNILEQGLLQ